MSNRVFSMDTALMEALAALGNKLLEADKAVDKILTDNAHRDYLDYCITVLYDGEVMGTIRIEDTWAVYDEKG